MGWKTIFRFALLLTGAGVMTLLVGCAALHGVNSTPSSGTTTTLPTTSGSTTSPTPATSPTPLVTPTPTFEDVALHGTVTVSSGAETARQAIDNNIKTMWSAGASAPQSYMVTLDKAYMVHSIQLVVAQTPAGQTTQEIWLGSATGSMTLYKKLVNTFTDEGQTLTIPIEPPRIVTRVLIRTDSSPSFVAWHEVRVLGSLPTGNVSVEVQSTPAAAPVVNWPKIGVTGQFDQPVQVTNAADGSNRLFVAERTGTIRIVKDGVPLDKPFLDITDRVKCCNSEQGLFSIAFPPNFQQKQYFYVSYTAKPVPGKFGPIGDTVIARFHVSANPNVADPNSEEVIIVLPQPADAHNGGHLAFGPKDGYLYIGSGDGGLENDSTNQAQNPDSLLGKILRIDVESGVKPYAIPPTNPFVGKPGYRPEIWALGFRNPWQFSFDSKTGDLYIGDVGENNYEEIDFQPASSHGGENYGWRIMEGSHCHLTPNCDVRGFTFPVSEYPHTEGCAVIGGTVYRGSLYPDMDGVYFYADLCTGRIWGLKQVGGQWQTNLLADEPFQITNIGEDEQGNLYVTDFSDGTIMRIDEPGAS